MSSILIIIIIIICLFIPSSSSSNHTKELVNHFLSLKYFFTLSLENFLMLLNVEERKKTLFILLVNKQLFQKYKQISMRSNHQSMKLILNQSNLAFFILFFTPIHSKVNNNNKWFKFCIQFWVDWFDLIRYVMFFPRWKCQYFISFDRLIYIVFVERNRKTNPDNLIQSLWCNNNNSRNYSQGNYRFFFVLFCCKSFENNDDDDWWNYCLRVKLNDWWIDWLIQIIGKLRI